VDLTLVQRAMRGDVDAFTELAAARLESMVRTAMAILGHEADARDVVQDALVAVWRGLPRLREANAFDAWATSIVLNECRGALKRRVRGRVREITALGPDNGGAATDRDLTAGLPAGVDLEAEVLRRRAINRAFERLDADDRSILVLHHLDGRSTADLAAVLGIPIGTVKSRLHSARVALAAALEREEPT
jgi:RNA polymerase sigma-70 factor (ECF subfamily)